MQSQNTLDSLSHLWTIERSCGLPGTDPLHLIHPACLALETDQITTTAYAEQVVEFCRNLYEQHFRATLQRNGLNRSAIETVLTSLWDALYEKVCLLFSLH